MALIMYAEVNIGSDKDHGQEDWLMIDHRRADWNEETLLTPTQTVQLVGNFSILLSHI